MANAAKCATGMGHDILPSSLLLSTVSKDGEQFFVATFRILLGFTQPLRHQLGILKVLILCVVFEKNNHSGTNYD
jgi:hypothetical protein